jgi:hypothetical protein
MIYIQELCGIKKNSFHMSDHHEREQERLNAEILYWMNETDKRKVQLGEYLLDAPCDPDDSLWERLAAREVAMARERIAADPCAAMGIIMELVRDKQECLVSLYMWVCWYPKTNIHSTTDASQIPRRHHFTPRISACSTGIQPH